MSTHRPFSWWDRFAYALLLLVVAGIPWPWGSVNAVPQAIALLLTGLGLIFTMLAPEAEHWPKGRTFRLAVVAWLVWLTWLAFSLLPLPTSWLAVLSPVAAETHQSIATLGIAPANTLSVEPSATRLYLITSTGLFAIYLLAARTIHSPARRRGLLAVMALVAGAQAFYGLGMTLTGQEIGFFERKTYGRGWATGTFINRNHYSNLLALGAACALGLLLAWRTSPSPVRGWRGRLLRGMDWLMSPALVWRVLLLVMLSAVVLSQSRMGNVVFVLVMAFGVLLWTALYNRARLLTAVLLLASFAVADLWIVNNYYGLDRVVQRLDDTELETEQRAIALRDLQPLIDSYRLTGSGGGSFQSVFMATQSEGLRGLYDHAHNEYAEFAIEHGFAGLGWMLLMGALHLAHALRLLRFRRSAETRALALAGAVALLATGLHALTDFILHIPALRVWVVVLMGAVAAASANIYAGSKRRVSASGSLGTNLASAIAP